jgi:hypothetical protein
MTERFGQNQKPSRTMEVDAMLAKTAIALAVVFAIAPGTLAASQTRGAIPADQYNVYNPAGAYVGTDPDANIRFELNRDWTRGR